MTAPAFQKFGVMIDCSRNAVMTINTFKTLVDILSDLGYNTIRLYTEDTYEVDGEPYFGYLRGRYTKAELKEMDTYALTKGVELIPCIQTLAHLGTLFKYDDYKPINDIEKVLLVGEERTYTLIRNMFKTIAECFSTKNVHIGMDEARKIGRGKYLEKNGLVPPAEIIKQHLDKVLKIAQEYDFQCEIWGDMYMQSAYGDRYVHTKDDSEYVKNLVPQNVKLCYWDYYHTEITHYERCIECHKKLSNNISVAGGIWTWKGFCPNNRYSLEIGEAAIKACLNKGVDEFYFTLWGDGGAECMLFSALPSLVAGAEFAKGNFDISNIKKIFKQKIGMDFDLFSSLECPDFIYEKTEVVNATRAMLYSDPLCGIFDANVQEGIAPAYYETLSAYLKTGEDNPKWGYLFKNIRALCDVLAVRFDLGVKTRKAYKSKDTATLKKIVEEDYPMLLTRLETFYNAFEEAWMTERKPFGFEVQDIRIGGAIRRVKHCKQTLEKYLIGELKQVDELEQEILPPFGMTRKNINGVGYANLPTTGVM